MKIGIIGLSGSGKSTIFQALTGAELNYSSDANIATIKVPDKRLEFLRDIYQPKKYTPAEISFFDLLPISDTKGELGNSILKYIKTADAIIEVINAFAKGYDKKEVLKTVEMLDLELILTDLQVVENRITRLNKPNSKESFPGEKKLLMKCKENLEDNIPLRSVGFNSNENKFLRGFQLLSLKPVLYLINIGEDDINRIELINNELIELENTNSKIGILSGEIEKELMELPDDDRKDFMDDLGLKESGRAIVIRKAYSLLNLISYFTVGKDEVRAWPIPNGANAQEAAGVIHSDIARGFIRAEVVAFDDFKKYGSLAECKQKGVFRLEGKTYIVNDGDIINFRFNV